MKPAPTAVLAVIALAAALAAWPTGSRALATGRCSSALNEQTVLVIDGELYGGVRPAGSRRYEFGWSGQPVLSFPEALRLIRELGVKGTDRELFALASAQPRGLSYADGGSIGYFDLLCDGTYEATVVVRSKRFVPATRFWLQQQRRMRVVRSFCMPGQWLPPGARMSVTFAVPLSRVPPRFEIDRNHDGKIERTGRFTRGGSAFPSTERC